MRITGMLVLGGSCLSLFFAGCQKHDMLSRRGYIQAPEGSYSNDPSTISRQPSTIEQAKPAPAVTKEPVKVTIIKPEDDYQPTETISRQPDRAVIAAPDKHTVKKGDYLGKIGRQYGVGAAKLAAYNKIDINKPIHIGQTILIPPPGTVVHVDQATLKAATKPIKSASTAKANPNTNANTKLSDGSYIIKRGDSIHRIADRYKVKRSALMAANNLNENSVLQIGQKLVIPGKTTTEVPATLGKVAVTTSKAPKTVDNTLVIPSEQGTADDILAGIKDPVSADTTQLPVDEAPSHSVETVATPAAPDSASNVSKPFSIEAATDTTLAKVAAQYDIDLEVLKKANTDIKEGQVIRAGRLIFLPKQ